MPDFIVVIAIINLGLSVPIFFLFRRLFGKFDLEDRSNIFLSLFGAFTAPWMVFITTTLFLIIALTYYPKRDFDQAQWLGSPRTRYELSDDLIKRKVLIGKTKSEVVQLLGKENGNDEDYGGYRIQNSESSDQWQYFIGFEPAPMRIDASFLEIEFRDSKVIDAYLSSQ